MDRINIFIVELLCFITLFDSESIFIILNVAVCSATDFEFTYYYYYQIGNEVFRFVFVASALPTYIEL